MEPELFTTIPESIKCDRLRFSQELKDLARDSEKLKFKGMLVYSDNRLVDPWEVAAVILSVTKTFLPMVAVQPVYMHPYAVAKRISSIAYLHNRKIALNMVAGGYLNDMVAVGGTATHDQRYERLMEYTEIIQRLLQSPNGVTYEGRFYQIRNLKLHPPMPVELLPEVYMSGSSKAAKLASERLGIPLIEYPEPVLALSADNVGSLTGIRIGVIARARQEQAWSEAAIRFPETRLGQLSHKMASQTTDSDWHKKLTHHSGRSITSTVPPVYWLGPFENYHTFCPYLVGSFDTVAEVLTQYIELGCETIIVDTPSMASDLANTMKCVEMACARTEKQGEAP